MSEINNLTYFLNSIKKTLPFENTEDFKKKIDESKDFRIRVQKLVYLSKFFGWDNSYHFNFHENGPYSCQLSEDYHSIDSFDNLNNNIELDKNFNEFIYNKNQEFLEASSTILYYLNKVNLKKISKNKLTAILKYLKPHIPKNIIEKSYDAIYKYKLQIHDFSNHEIKLKKEIVFDKIYGLMNIFKNFELCSNQTLILGSLDYSRLALKRENLKKHEKNELLRRIYDYSDYIEKYYFNNYSLSKNFTYCDLRQIDEKFDELQNYIADLGILPRLYDEDVDLNIFCE